MSSNLLSAIILLHVKVKVLVKVLVVCNPMACPWNSPGKNIGAGCHSLQQGIFSTQGSYPGLLH